MHPRTLAGFASELQKIAEFSLAGVSPGVVEDIKHRSIMETQGLQKAKDILDRASSMQAEALQKTAAEENDGRAARHVGATLAGATAGTTLGSLIGKTPHQGYRRAGAALGAGVGLAHSMSKPKKKEASSPLQVAMAAKKTGVHTGHALHMGKAPSKNAVTIGKLGRLPKFPGA